MEDTDAEKGVEITHPEYGRGVIREYLPNFGGEPDDIIVRFYELDDSLTLPVYTVQLAHTVATASIEPGRFGFTAVVDDGMGTIVIQPDGTGEGYSIELRREGESLDTARISQLDS